MSNTIGSVGNSGYSTSASQSIGRHHRPDPAKLAETLFSSLDTSGKGYVEIADLQAAMDSTATASGKTSVVSAKDVFTSLDTDSDGKVTKQEMTDSIKKLADDLESQFQSSRMNNAMAGMGGPGRTGGMPPPPPPKDDAGFTKDELTSQVNAADSTDTKRTSLLSDIVENFDAADTNGDGKVSFQEAMNYQSTAAATSSSEASSATTSSSSTTNDVASASNEKKVMWQIMKLVAAYADFGGTTSSAAGAGLSVTV